MDWNEDTIARLRGLWDEGHSTAEIGRRMGVSKNAVVGKAHRLALPPRPSPIRRGEGAPADRAAPRRAGGAILPVLEAAGETRPDAGPARRAGADGAGTAPPCGRPSPAPVQASRPVALAKPAARTGTCCWPIGEPGTRSFRFCDTPAMGGKPYCLEHVQLAYVKVRDRREDAA